MARASSNIDGVDDHPEFDNNSKWPRRLLHVPSMTSHKWEPGNRYGDSVEPAYVAISYTWGRYRLSDGELPHVKPLPIQGVDWPIPRVNPVTHFSVSEFQGIIKEVMKVPDRFYDFTDYRWRQRTWKRQFLNTCYRFIENRRWAYKFLWLDIACIDQRSTRTAMLEVGRQARIFRHAKQSYAWLSRLPTATLRPLLYNLRAAVHGLQNEPWTKGGSQGFHSRPWLRMAIDSLTGLLDDPWFSSLWTLQEAFLCTNAIILSHHGEAALDVSTFNLRPWTLQQLFTFANDLVLWSERSRAPKAEPEFDELMELVHRSGLAALHLNNPMALLGVSYTRKPSRDLDRIYGIMQVFGSEFKVGLSREGADSHKKYTLAELEDEFGAAIIEHYPILNQMHVYLSPPELGKGWCVRGNSAVPMIAERGDLFGWDSGNRIDVNIEIGHRTMCEISTLMVNDSMWAKLSGRSCSFAKLQQAWRQADRSPLASKMLRSNWRMHRSSIPSIHMIALDRGTPFEPQAPQLRILNVIGLGPDEYQHDLALWITEQPNAEDLQVFLLGRSQMGEEYFYTGMLLIERTTANITYWHRVGICMWLTSHLSNSDNSSGDHPVRPLLIGETEEWQTLKGLFG